MSFKTLAALLAATAAASFAAGAQAAPEADATQMSVTVPVSDLHLSREGDARTALHRIEGAANVVCAPRPDIRELSQTAAYHRCMLGAVNGAVASAGSPMLNALAQGRPAPAPVLAAGR